jgi:hypothetical protein
MSELRRISSLSMLALLLFGLSLILDGPISVLAWILTVAGLLCLAYLAVASRIILNRHNPTSRKSDTP